VPLALGQNTFTIQATDPLGNTRQSTTTVALNSGPIVSAPIPNVTVAPGAPDMVIDFNNFFSDVDAVGTLIRFNTIAGPI